MLTVVTQQAAFIDSCQTVAKTANALSPNSPGKSPLYKTLVFNERSGT